MTDIEKQIWDAAMRRVAEVFGIDLEAVRPALKFGEDLKSSFVSDFRRNEFDLINDDIHDVANRKVTKEIASGSLVIRTVEDYCFHMIRCHKAKPKAVKQALNI
ncbi:hypothetical protein [Amantichitinum ursilacus]|uniref:Uncharacterized protein n=1 Tax=Amantichitinum ursilacus TaxID=857265 RepID=A0A0N0XJF4_9NEIS|nr:hypothetical protein [Amantichitinum ursilacus]KPC50712.1 hypothetical protein WG78_16700 [Amantichitinum ursilacus]